MKTGKGILFYGARCQECGERIGPGSTEQPAYWASERGSGWHDTWDGRTYYHRSCARKVTKRREAAYRAEMARYGA